MRSSNVDVINVTLVETRTMTTGKKEVEKKKFQMKKSHSLNDFKKHLMKEFNTDNENTFTIYSIDWDGELTEITENEEFLDKESVAFKVVFDESNTAAKDIYLEEDKHEVEKDDNEGNEDLNVDIDDKELRLIVDEEVNKEEEKKEVFDSKLFGEELLNKFLSSQEKVINESKLNLDNNIKSIMDEKSEIFKNLKDISEIIDKSKKIMTQSQLIKKKEPEKGHNNHILFDDENDDDQNVVDLKFLEEKIELTKEVKEAKWIELEVSFRNIGKRTFTGGDLYFEIGKESSEDFYLTGVKKERKQHFSLNEDLVPTKEMKERLTFRNEDPKNGNTYTLYLYLASEKYKIKMQNPLKIVVHVEEKKEEEKNEEEKKEEENEELKIEEPKKEEQKEIEIQQEVIKINNGGNNNNNDQGNDDENKIQEIYNRLEDEYYISNFKGEEEVKQKIRELNFNMDEIINWIESIM